MRRPAPGALDARLGDDDVGRGEPRADAGDDIAPRRCVRAGDDADRPWEAGQGALALGREQPLGGEHPLEALDRGEMVAEPDSLDRARAEAELALGLVDLGLALDEHALAVAATRARGCRIGDAASSPAGTLRSQDP